jgi:DNA-directed RNA polymerase specialized sigma24 family protein
MPKSGAGNGNDGGRGVGRRCAAVYGTSLYPTALRITGNPPDAEDLVQEALAKALAASGRFQPART